MASLKLVIGNKNYSSWSLRPWLFLKNLEIDFKEELIHLYKENTDDVLSSYFSNKKVPLLVKNGDEESALEVWDSLAIIEYIADKYNKGWPTELNARAIARSVSAEMHSSFPEIRSALPMNCRKIFSEFPISDDVQQEIDRIIALWEYSSSRYGQNGPWLFGEFSGADAMFAPVVLRLTGYDVPLSGFSADYSQMVLENKHMKAWIESGKQEADIIDQSEM